MYKAGKEIIKALPSIDLVIEILDARIPFSSENPMLKQIRGNKPCIKILNKSDLADPEITLQWQNWLDKEQGVKTLSVDKAHSEKVKQISNLCLKLVPHKKDNAKGIRAMIMGIPNVGKSTLINTLAGRTIARTGNEPAITKAQQRIEIDGNLVLFDTPGMLWPKVENKNSGYRLAVTGAIRDTAIEHSDIAFFAAEYLLENYPENLRARYNLESLPESELELLETIGKKRGCLRAGGDVELDKVSKLFLNDIRQGELGEISYETPSTIKTEMEELALILEEKAARNKSRKQKFKHKK
jgi:ribosome biogenesis GTPase A